MTLTLTRLMAVAAGRGQGVVFIHEDDRHERLEYAELLLRSRRVASTLLRHGVQPGARVPIVLPTSPTFLTSFFGTMLAGAIPCPMALPMGFGQLEAYAQRFTATLRYLGATHAIIEDTLGPIGMMLPEVTFIGGGGLAAPTDDPVTTDPTTPDGLAFLQCTSGSTGSPKGVMLTHANLLANVNQITRALSATSADVVVSWLPLYHDMGLIGTVLFPMFGGFDTVLMSPLKFQKRPAAWLQAISRYRGTISTAPNFAYAYATARIKDAELAGVDLSSWRDACCGAEPIDPATLEAFVRRFASHGLPATAARPCYGLAEASLGVSFCRQQSPLVYDTLDRPALARGEVLPPESPERATRAVRCGRPVEGMDVRIVDERGAPLGERRVGRILLRGPSITRGYYQLPEETAAVLRDGWLDTGDLGYLTGGELVISGRAKDVIIVRGQKFPPTDFEWAAEQTPGVRRGTAVAFSAPSGLLYVACETDAPEEQLAAVRAELVTRVAAKTGLKPDVVAMSLVRHAIPKTSSGKLQRRKTRELILGEEPGWRT